MNFHISARPARLLAGVLALLFAGAAAAQDCAGVEPGSSSFTFTKWDGPKLPVFAYRPQAREAESRVVFVMRGTGRDADRYRDEWRDIAETHNLVIVAPAFGRKDFPTADSYNLGNLRDAKGRETRKSRQSFAAIEPLFDEVRCRLRGKQSHYSIYGHSAGGQFVHRYVTFADAPRLKAAVSANSGWYTMPNGEAFPYGLKIGSGGERLATAPGAFGRSMTILLGTADTRRDDPNLRRTEEADRQGLTRFARGHAYLAAASENARAAGVELGWKIAYVPAVGHENAKMASFAVPHLIGSELAPRAAAPTGTPPVDAASLRQRPGIAVALSEIERLETKWAIDRLVELTQIPAPPFGEQARAAAFARMLDEVPGIDVKIDGIGNVVGRRKGRANGKTVMLAAHLDTAFEAGTDVTVKRDGNRFTAPGIGDNTRGLVALLLVAKALERGGIETAGDVVFVGTVGEEGAGDLRGMRHFFKDAGHGVDTVIAIDGGEAGRVVADAVGSNRYRMIFTGPGGHSYGAFGTVNPHHATAKAIAGFLEQARLVTQFGPKATYSVATLEGGLGINVIPTRSSFEIDLRSADPGRLAALDAILQSAIAAALANENAGKADDKRLQHTVEVLGKRPAAAMPPGSPLLANAFAALAELGITAEREASSTDANIPMSLGIPSITMGRGGVSTRAHSTDEYWLAENQHLGPQATLLTVLLEAGIAAPAQVSGGRTAFSPNGAYRLIDRLIHTLLPLALSVEGPGAALG